MNAQQEGAESTALVKRTDPGYSGLIMHSSPAEAKRRMQELQAFVAEAMVEGVDFGTIPGTDKPSLWQPGAQKLGEMYGLAAEFKFVEKIEDWTREPAPFFYYKVETILTDRRTGSFVGMGVGSCNSREKRYAGRWVADSKVPSWLDKKTLKKRDGVEWLWRSKLPAGIDITKLQTQERDGTNGKYTVWAVPSVEYFVPNEDICDLVNTLQKMACKRSHVHAVLQVTRSAGVFTQDVEDLPAEAIGYVEERRPWERDAEIAEGEVVERKPDPKLEKARADLAAQVEKRRAKKDAPATAAAAGGNGAAPAAEEKKAEPVDVLARAQELAALLDAAKSPVEFNTIWRPIATSQQFEELRIVPVLAESFKRNKARIWPAPAAPAADQAPKQEPPKPEPKPEPDPLEERWMSEISRAGGDEGARLWNAINEAWQGNVPARVLEAYAARWPLAESGAQG